MPRISLSVNEIDELISAYRSSLKKMRYQINQVNDTIKGLEDMKAEKLEPKEVKVKVKQKPDVKKKPGKPGRKPKRGRKPLRTPGYKLSDWDEFLIQTIRENNKPMTSAELIDAALEMVKKENMNVDEVAVKGKIARSLQKLANKRGTLGKGSSAGKGYVYGLGEWFFARSGRLKKAYIV